MTKIGEIIFGAACVLGGIIYPFIGDEFPLWVNIAGGVVAVCIGIGAIKKALD